MANEMKIRLSDIAQRLNVSTVTVSKALAGKDGVGEDLRQRIHECAKEMGYIQKKNQVLRSDMLKGTGNIGIVVPERFFDRHGSFYWVLYNAISRELLSRGYYAIIEQLDEDMELSLSMPHVIKDGKVDGIMVMGQVSEPYTHFFSKNYNNFLFIDFSTGDAQQDSVTSDNFYLEYLLTRHLIDLGHRNLRFVGTFNSTSSINDRFMGFAKAMFENGLRVTTDDIVPDRDRKGVFISPMLPEEIPTAFVCNCDECAIRIIKELRQRGLRVPEDVSVVGFDDFLSTPYDGPALTTAAVNFESMARTVVDIMLRKITGQPYNKGCTVVGGRLVFRESEAAPSS
ncbi:MAG: LacI family DNA-binding transcriptional regulator [Treponema sp.]|nr:LacI family DNA-binding transcriptional regulator [Treponema sp.]